MKRVKYKNYGREAEEKVATSLDTLLFEYQKEKVAHSGATGRTSKGKFDFRIWDSCGSICIEVKTNGGNPSIPSTTNSNPEIKTHQLTALREESKKLTTALAGLLINYRQVDKWYFMSIQHFDKMILENYPVKSILVKYAAKYGIEIKEKNGILDLGKLLNYEELGA